MVPAIKRLKVQWEDEILYRKSYNKIFFIKVHKLERLHRGYI